MEDSIELRELFNIIFKGKWIITIITVLCILLAALLSWFVLPEKYESRAVVQVESGVQDTGVLENFVATEFSTQVFTERVQNEDKINEAFINENLQNEFNIKNLDIKSNDQSKIVTIKYKSNSPENAQKELETILITTKNEMNHSVQNTLENLESTYIKNANALSVEIETIINDYNTIIRNNGLPEVLILQTILDSEMVINISDEQTKTLSSVSGSIQNKLLQLQAQIQTKSEEYQNVLSKYESVKTGLENFKPDPFIRVIAEPNLPKEKSSPNYVLNLVIGFILGIMIGLGTVFIRHYFKHYLPSKK